MRLGVNRAEVAVASGHGAMNAQGKQPQVLEDSRLAARRPAYRAFGNRC